MCRRKVRDLGARLMRTRALSVCLGDRSYSVRPLDRSPGRPPRGLAGFFKRPYRCEVEPLSVIVPDCIRYLQLAGHSNGWFSIEERADILGTHVPLHVRSFDVFVTAGSLFAGPNSLFLPRNDLGELTRRGSVNLTEVSHG